MKLLRTGILALRRAWLRLVYDFAELRGSSGIEAMNERLLRTRGVEAVLRQFGAEIGDGAIVHGPIIVHNAERDYSNLRLARGVHIGRMVFFDLTDRLTVEEEATVSMGVTILTHADIGDRPLAATYPREVAPTRIGAASYVGANATLLAGCHIGERSVVGAGAVVVSPVPADTVVAGVPARAVESRRLTRTSRNRRSDG